MLSRTSTPAYLPMPADPTSRRSFLARGALFTTASVLAPVSASDAGAREASGNWVQGLAGEHRRARRTGDSERPANHDPDPLGSSVRPVADNAIYSVKDWGALGNGVADDTDKIRKALADAAALSPGGFVLYFPEGEYLLSNYLPVTIANVRFVGVQGASRLRWKAFGAFLRAFGFSTTMNGGIVADVDNFQIEGIKLSGPRAANTYAEKDALLSVVGLSSATRRQGLRVWNCEFTNSGAYGVYAQFTDGVDVDRNYIHEVGLCAIQCLSCSFGRITNNRVKTIRPGTSGDMYCISLSHDSSGYNADPNAGTKNAMNPFCASFDVAYNWCEDCAWTGIDAHGCYETKMVFNRVYNTRFAIACSSSSGDAAAYAGYGNLVGWNICDARTPAGAVSGRERTGHGININGGTKARSELCQVRGNLITAHGEESNGNSGSIIAVYTTAAVIAGNTIRLWGGPGINITEAQDVAVDDNVFLEAGNPADTSRFAIYSGTVGAQTIKATGNRVSANGGTAASAGFRAAAVTTRPRLSDNEFSAATSGWILPQNGFLVGGDSTNVVVATSGDATPSLAGAASGEHLILEVPAASAFTITQLVGARQYQRVTVVNTGAFAVTFTRANSVLAGAVDWIGHKYDTLTLVLIGANWHEICRSENNG